MDAKELFFLAIETHNLEKLEKSLSEGLDINDSIDGMNLLEHLVYMYLRSNRFTECASFLIEKGVVCESTILRMILTEDFKGMSDYLGKNPNVVDEKVSFKAPFLSLNEVSLLHLCAEFNLVKASEILIKHGADINSKAIIDERGLGGQSPVFHALNQLQNISYPMLELLVSKGADLNHQVKGLIWGEGLEWETYCPELNPISYAMLGQLQVFGRNPVDVKKCIELMQEKKYGSKIDVPNIPNDYRVRRDKMVEDHIRNGIENNKPTEEIIKALKW
jgi:hypothetical protein